jgi:uncharacterized membrane protein
VNYNPYAAPQAPPPPQAPGGPGQPQPWTASDALSFAWARFKVHGGILVVSYMFFTFTVAILGQAPNVLTWTKVVAPGTPAQFGVLGGGYLFGQVVSSFFQVGLARIWLDAARGTPPRFETLFSGADRFLPMLGLNVVFSLGFVLGCAFFIVPGVLLMMVYQLAPYYVVEGGLGPVEALRQSWVASEGQRGELFVLTLAGAGLGLAGLLMCCVGIQVTIPLYLVSTAVAFTRVSGLGAAAPPAPFPAQPLVLP